MALSICVAVSANWPEYGMIRPILTVPCWALAVDAMAISAAAPAKPAIDVRMKSSRYLTAWQPFSAVLAPTVVAAGYRVNLAGAGPLPAIMGSVGGNDADLGRHRINPS